jgi:hypothetical protein
MMVNEAKLESKVVSKSKILYDQYQTFCLLSRKFHSGKSDGVRIE